MAKLIITRGLPASGKTTAARAWVDEDPAHRARVNRDDLRAMLHGGRLGTSEQEEQVTAAQHQAITALLRSGRDVICDDTNLHRKHVDALRYVGSLAFAKVEVWNMTDVPIDVCIERDKDRPSAARVGEQVIRDMWQRYLAEALPPIPEPGYYLDRSGNAAQIKDRGNILWFGDEIDTEWEQAHYSGPFVRLVPETQTFPRDGAEQMLDVLRDIEAAITNGHEVLPSTVYLARRAIADADRVLASQPKAVE